MVKQSKLLKIKSKILSNLFNEKYGLQLGEFHITTGTEMVKPFYDLAPNFIAFPFQGQNKACREVYPKHFTYLQILMGPLPASSS